jgi:hypothetical protein
MKRFYTLAITLSALFLFSYSADAQLTYTAVRNGNWHTSSGPNVWDLSGEPPAKCTGCTIVINSGDTVTLNVSDTLSTNATLILGTNSALGGAQLVIPASGATGFATGNNIMMDNSGGTGSARIVVFDASSSISALTAGTYDGVVAANGIFQKLIGNAPSVFMADGTSPFNSPATYRASLSGPITLGAPGTLPIVLSDFTAVLNNNAVDLAWTTSMEINSDHFVVDRSVDAGTHWQSIGTVTAHGVSGLPIDYTFTDQSPAAGTSEYRLQMVDKDGKYDYSEVKTIRTGLVSSVNIYPNPAKDYVNVTLGGEASGSVSIRLINQAGQILLEKKIDHAGGTTVSLAVSGYPQGNYLILVAGTDGVQQVSKLLISK